MTTPPVKEETIIHCPTCGFAREETMPTNFCLIRYECRNCGEILQPQAGDCCVFCSYADDKCPPIQSGTSCST